MYMLVYMYKMYRSSFVKLLLEILLMENMNLQKMYLIEIRLSKFFSTVSVVYTEQI